MNVKQLKELLSNEDDNTEVYAFGHRLMENYITSQINVKEAFVPVKEYYKPYSDFNVSPVLETDVKVLVIS